MPRIEFACFKEAEVWLNKYIKQSEKGYIGYYTNQHELIFVPTKSTQPIVYGLIKICGEEDAKRFGADAQIDIFKINKFEWNAERGLSFSEV